MTTTPSTRLIIRKDLRRFWPLLTLWFAALVVRAALDAWLGDERGLSNRQEGMFAVILVVLLNITLVSRVIAEDSPIKEAAFWRIMPVTGGQLLRAKLMFLGGWTVLLPMTVSALAAWYYDFTAGEIVRVVLGQGMLHGMIGLGIGMLAVLTERVLVSFVGLWFAMVLGQIASTTLRPTSASAAMQSGPYASLSLEWTRMTVGGVLVLLACGGAAAWVYARRERLGALGALALGVAGAWASGTYWAWDLLGEVPTFRRLAAVDDERHRLTVVRTGMESGSTINGVSLRHLDATLRWSGSKNGEVFATYLIAGRATLADGTEIAQFNEIHSAAGYDVTIPLREIGIERVRNFQFTSDTEEGVTLMKLRPEQLQATAGQPVTWRGEVSAKVGRVEIEARVPLTPRAVYQDGAFRFRIAQVETGNAEIKVSCIERRPDLPTPVKRANNRRVVSGVMPLMYALIHPQRGEAILASGGGGSGGSSDGYFEYNTRTLYFQQRSDLAKQDQVEWAEWLRGAELVSFRFVEERRVKKEVEVAHQP